MKARIQQFVTTLILALTLAVGIGVSTSAMTFASSSTSTPASLQKTTVLATGLHVASAKAQNAFSSCTSYLVPQLQWEYYLEAVSTANPSVIFWFQGQPIYGQLDRVNIWESTNAGKTSVFLGTFQPTVNGPGFVVRYVNNNPWVTLCGYAVSFP